jgi:3-phosphoshikimate 1-carboxyvinyltransferase
MTTFRVHRPAVPLRGELRVPGDKSIGHRAVILAALADGRSRVHGLSGGEDNRRTIAAFRALGVAIADGDEGALTVDGVGLDGLAAAAAPLDCGNSGTTMRLLAGVLAPRPFASTLVGDEYLHARPMGRVAEPLRAMGARIAGQPGRKAGELYPPLLIGPSPRALHGIDYRSPIASAQVKSAVLLAALSAESPTRFVEPHLSRDHTERMLRAMGAPLSVEGGVVCVDPRGWDRRLAARDLTVPGDLSSAAFLIGAALLVPGSEVVVRGVGTNPSRTGVLDALRAMGAAITVENLRDEGGEPVADLRARSSALRGAVIDGELAVRAIDEIPLLGALAAHAAGTTTIADAAELRVKESDRLAAMAAALAAIGVSVEERPDGLVIEGGRARGGRVGSRGDHRIAMAFAVCALATDGETHIDDVANVATSFPGFAPSLARLGAPIEGVPGAEPT